MFWISKLFVSTLFVFLVFVVVESKSNCLTTFCGENRSLPIHYPFQLESSSNQHQKGCDQNRAVSLKCSSNLKENVPVLTLPSTGDLYVRNVNYTAQTIQLYDPNNCLPALFMNSNFSFSPLIPLNYQNYTFYSCPSNATTRSNFTSIGCLSNTAFSVLATSSISRAQEMNNLGCNMIITVQIPVSSPLQFEYNGFSDDLLLTWDVPDCDVCKNNAKHKGTNAGVVEALLIAPLIMPFPVTLVIYLVCMGLNAIVGFLRVVKRSVRRNLYALASRSRGRSVIQAQVRLPVKPAQPRRIDIEPVMNTIVVGESQWVPGANSAVCPICLEDYNPRDTIKCSIKCKHYFHAICIDLWRRTHNSCPICRTMTP